MVLMSPPHCIAINCFPAPLSPETKEFLNVNPFAVLCVLIIKQSDLHRSVITQNSKTEEGKEEERETERKTGRKGAGQHILLKCLILGHQGSSVS